MKHDDAGASGLSAADLALAVHGPWHPAAEVTEPKPLWAERCSTTNLRRLWLLHEAVIRQAAGGATPWILARLEFVADLEGRR